MRLTDSELMDKIGEILSKIASEGRISKYEANKIAFYALYNNTHFTTIYDDYDDEVPSNGNKSLSSNSHK